LTPRVEASAIVAAPRRTMRRVEPRTIARKLALSFFSAVALLFAAEVAARCTEPGPFALYDESPYDKHGELKHVQKPRFRGAWDGSYYEINSRGWRGPEFKPTSAPDELRVVALGDSCTFGKAVEESDCWPRQLERELRAAPGAYKSVLVANLGVNGYSGSDYVLSFLKQAAPVRPQLVIVGYNINDFPNAVKQIDATVFQNESNLRSLLSYQLRDSLGKLACYRWMRARYYDANRAKDLAKVEAVAKQASAGGSASDERMRDEEARLRELVAACDELGAHVVLFLFPYESQVYLDEYAHGPLEAVKTMAANLGVEYVDVLDRFRAEARKSDTPARLFIRGDRYHPNARGYELVADALNQFVRERGWLDVR